jgi:membrane protease YdiL (CAAX protease family)
VDVLVVILGAVAITAAWRVVAAGRAQVLVLLPAVISVAAAAALLTGEVHLSPDVDPAVAAAAGLGVGVLLYLATGAFLFVARRLPAFDRYVAEIYGPRDTVTLPLALLLGAGISAPGEEIFWRGLVQTVLSGSIGTGWGAAAAWGLYMVANAASGSLAILAGAVVSGAVWTLLAVWTHGVLASIVCHVTWTGLMILVPPGGPGLRS